MLRKNDPNNADFRIDADTPYLKGVEDAIAQSQYLRKLDIHMESNDEAREMKTLLNAQ